MASQATPVANEPAASPRVRCVIWDFDGTLVDSPVAVQAATNAALAEHGLPPASLEAVQSGMVLATVPRMAHHAGIAVDDPLAQRLNDDFYRHAHREFPARARPFPGIEELLRGLAARGIRQGVVTNNLGEIARGTLARAGLADCFASILGDGDTPAHKPDPRGAWMAAAACGVAPAACAYIGDSSVDLLTAQAAGMLPIAVSWGTTPRDRLTGFALVCDRPEDILAAVR